MSQPCATVSGAVGAVQLAGGDLEEGQGRGTAPRGCHRTQSCPGGAGTGCTPRLAPDSVLATASPLLLQKRGGHGGEAPSKGQGCPWRYPELGAGREQHQGCLMLRNPQERRGWGCRAGLGSPHPTAGRILGVTEPALPRALCGANLPGCNEGHEARSKRHKTLYRTDLHVAPQPQALLPQRGGSGMGRAVPPAPGKHRVKEPGGGPP